MLTAEQVSDEAWFEEAGRLVERWFELEDPTRLEPADRELYVETEVDGLTLRGYIDRLDIAPTGQVRIVDYKTGRSPNERFEAGAVPDEVLRLKGGCAHGARPARLLPR